MGALFGILRAALPWAASILGGYVVSDVFNERLRAKQEQAKSDVPAVIGAAFQRNKAKWGFFALGGLAVGALTVFLTKKLR